MSTPQQDAQRKREAILNLLSDEETAKVSRAEGDKRLLEADEYIDLNHLDRGVLQVHADSKIVPGQAIPRSAVSDSTWAQIIKHLGIHHT